MVEIVVIWTLMSFEMQNGRLFLLSVTTALTSVDGVDAEDDG